MSSLRQQHTSISVMRPPKPPSWRDFVASDANNKLQPPTATIAPNSDNNTPTLSCRVLETKSATHLYDIRELPRPSITSLSSAALWNKSSEKSGRYRPRAKIHRTRSEHGITTDDLPQGSLPPILKVATAPGTGAEVNQSFSKPDDNSSSTGYPASLEINRRCQSWLASIEACEPLDEVSYSASTPIPSPVATSVAYEKKKTNSNNDFGAFGAFPIPCHAYGEDVDVEVPDEMFVWRGRRRSSSPLSQEETFPPITITDEFRTARKNKKGSGAKLTKLASSGSQKDAFIPIIDKQFLPSEKLDNTRVEYSNFHSGDDANEALKKNNKKKCSKFCCDMRITFNCYRRKHVQTDI